LKINKNLASVYMWVWVGGGVPYVPLTQNTSINLTRMEKQSTSCRHLLNRAERSEARRSHTAVLSTIYYFIYTTI